MHESFANSDIREFAHGVGPIKEHEYAYVEHSSTTRSDQQLLTHGGYNSHCMNAVKKLSASSLRKAFDVIDHEDHSINHWVLLNGIDLKSYL